MSSIDKLSYVVLIFFGLVSGGGNSGGSSCRSSGSAPSVWSGRKGKQVVGTIDMPKAARNVQRKCKSPNRAHTLQSDRYRCCRCSRSVVCADGE